MENIAAAAQQFSQQDSLQNYSHLKLSGDKRILYGYNKAQKQPKLNLPSIVKANDDEMMHHFQFKAGDNQLNSRSKVTGKDQFVQQTSITIEGEKYHFLTSIQYDGKDFKSLIIYNWTDNYPFEKAETDSNFDRWELCHDGQKDSDLSSGSSGRDVWIQMATSFDEENDWAHPEADIKTQIYIDNDGTYYRTYVDLDQLVLTSKFYYANQLLGTAEWQFSNTTWHSHLGDSNKAITSAKLANTTYDPQSGASMTVRSFDSEDNSRSFSLKVNESFSMEDFIEFSDPWTFEQLISMNDLNLADEDNYQVKTKLQFTGHFWRQQIQWDANTDSPTIISFDIEKGFKF